MVQVAHQGAGAPQVHGGLGRAFARNYVRRSSLEYSGLRGEGSIPVPLPPPACPRAEYSPVNSRAIKPSNSTDFSIELRTPDRQSRPIILRKAGFSLKLWTPSIRYGSRNSNVWSYI